MFKNIFKNDEWKRSEHMAVRECVGYYLFTHQLMEVTGEEAGKFLDYVYPNNIATLAVGRDRYTTMLNEEGEIIDDVVVMRLDEDRYWVSTLYGTKCDDWFYYHSEGYDVETYEITEDWHMFSVQGPKSKEVLNSILTNGVEDLKFFQNRTDDINGIEVIVNRGGFTGEKFGYEIYCAADMTDDVQDVIDNAVKAVGGREITEFQVFAWTLPTEAGFYYMRDLAHTNPFEVGLEKNINWDKEFIGKEALLKIKENGPEREMLGFEVIDENENFYIRAKQYGGPGEPIFIDGEEEEIGRVSKMVYSYVRNVNNGYMLVKKGKLHVGDKFRIHGYECVVTEKNWL
ncbi:MAG: aminomethyltransferase family protein [Erysipelotrichaceae bacterium]|nr:aminomethyltransferase family protein [Erysipelotrichaceae bacterium]MBR6957666.1 aminomethyltransferase family protein [Erysipelotrichaceae bacterium]